MSTKSTNPLFRSDCILLLVSTKELRDSDQSVVPQLETVLGDFPRINMWKFGGKDREAVIDQSRIDKQVVIPRSKVGEPHIYFQESLGNVFKKTLFGFDQVSRGISVVKQVENFGLSVTDWFEAYTEHDAKIGVQSGGFNVPR